MGVPEDYEAAVHIEIENNVRPDDVVWDVGANVGLYTEFFLRKVGRAGKVLLRGIGFPQVRWIDRSHLVAKRGT